MKHVWMGFALGVLGTSCARAGWVGALAAGAAVIVALFVAGRVLELRDNLRDAEARAVKEHAS